MHKIKLNDLLAQRWKIFLLALLTVVLLGCAEINYVRDAQEAFNIAAEQDNLQRYETQFDKKSHTPEDQTIFDTTLLNSAYTSVIYSVDHVSTQDRESLKKELLWGNMLTMKAISQWRLGQFNGAIMTANDALALENQLLPRDKEILTALPDLIRNDQAYFLTTTDKDIGNRDYVFWNANLYVPLNTAIDHLKKQSKKLTNQDRDDLALYIKMSELAARINLRDSYRKYEPCSKTDAPATCSDREKQEDADLETAVNEMGGILFLLKNCAAKDDALLTIWEKRTGNIVNSTEVFPGC